jgi:hypothetical protein
MSSSIPCYTRALNRETSRQIQELRSKYGDALLAHVIGIKRLALGWQRQPVPVQRAVAMFHCMTFRPGQRITLLDLLTDFRYTRKPPQSSPGAAASVAPGKAAGD